MALIILAPVVCRRLPAIPIESVIDSIGPAGHRENNAIRRNRCTGIKVRRAEIVEVEVIIGAVVPVMVPDAHIRSE
jgi:hypothetical protein